MLPLAYAQNGTPCCDTFGNSSFVPYLGLVRTLHRTRYKSRNPGDGPPKPYVCSRRARYGPYRTGAKLTQEGVYAEGGTTSPTPELVCRTFFVQHRVLSDRKALFVWRGTAAMGPPCCRLSLKLPEVFTEPFGRGNSGVTMGSFWGHFCDPIVLWVHSGVICTMNYNEGCCTETTDFTRLAGLVMKDDER